MSSHSVKLAKALRDLQNIKNIQGTAGNWNFSEYMHGMFNGIELAMAIMQDREPKFKDAPVQYLDGSSGKDKEVIKDENPTKN